MDALLDLMISHVPVYSFRPDARRNLVAADRLAAPGMKQRQQIEFLARKGRIQRLAVEVNLPRADVHPNALVLVGPAHHRNPDGSGGRTEVPEHQHTVISAEPHLVSVGKLMLVRQLFVIDEAAVGAVQVGDVILIVPSDNAGMPSRNRRVFDYKLVVGVTAYAENLGVHHYRFAVTEAATEHKLGVFRESGQAAESRFIACRTQISITPDNSPAFI